MKFTPRTAVSSLVFGILACALGAFSGCGGGSGGDIELAEAAGVVNFQGSPVEGARVMAYPATGPVATGMTDAEGRFTLSTGADPGVVVGSVKVSVTVPPPSTGGAVDTESMSQDELQAMMTQSTDVAATSLEESPIPLKYADINSSGLSYEIVSGTQNELTIDLVE